MVTREVYTTIIKLESSTLDNNTLNKLSLIRTVMSLIVLLSIEKEVYALLVKKFNK